MTEMVLAEAAPNLLEAAPINTLDVLVGVIESLASARSVEDIAAVVRTAARTVSGADGVAVVVRDGDRCHYIDEDAIGPLWKGARFPIDACISGWAMLNRDTAIIPDIYLDLRIPHDAYRPTFVKSLVVTPVGRDEPVAAIGAYWSQERRATDAEIEALSALARATATAFENVRLTSSLNEAIERRDFLIRELDHRVKNTLASVQALAQQTAKSTEDKDDFIEVFDARLMALARAHMLLTKESWKSAKLGDAAREAVMPFPIVSDRIHINGPPIVLGPVAAVAAQLALHELLTNALRHGSLSEPQGRVALAWSVDMAKVDRQLVLEWIELGGPPITAPTRRGMGLRLIEKGFPHAIGGQCKTEFAREGFRAIITAPLSKTVQLA